MTFFDDVSIRSFRLSPLSPFLHHFPVFSISTQDSVRRKEYVYIESDAESCENKRSSLDKHCDLSFSSSSLFINLSSFAFSLHSIPLLFHHVLFFFFLRNPYSVSLLFLCSPSKVNSRNDLPIRERERESKTKARKKWWRSKNRSEKKGIKINEANKKYLNFKREKWEETEISKNERREKTQKSKHSSSFHFQFFNLPFFRFCTDWMLPTSRSIFDFIPRTLRFTNFHSIFFYLNPSRKILLEKSFLKNSSFSLTLLLLILTEENDPLQPFPSPMCPISSSLFSSQFQMGKQKVSLFDKVFEGREGDRKRKRGKRWNGKTDFSFGHIVSLIPDGAYFRTALLQHVNFCWVPRILSFPFLFFLESFCFNQTCHMSEMIENGNGR